MKKIFHCFFEQSGTFKNEFKKLGYEAFDYDILNDFNETDYVIDLYKEIENAYDKKKSIFDNFNSEEDFIIAFFPCIRFEAQVLLNFRGENSGFKNWTMEQKLKYDLNLHEQLHHNYCLITKFVIICLDKKIPLIIENPYSTQHYLTRYWCLKPSIIDNDRTQNGDWFEKPTQYWFINCEPKNNFIFEPLLQVKAKTVSKCNKVDRSMIHPQYANRFIKEFIIDDNYFNIAKERIEKAENE